jgi:hypothetical protein
MALNFTERYTSKARRNVNASVDKMMMMAVMDVSML